MWSEGVALLQFVRRETERMKECNILHSNKYEIMICCNQYMDWINMVVKFT